MFVLDKAPWQGYLDKVKASELLIDIKGGQNWTF